MKKGIAVLIMSCLVLSGCQGTSKDTSSDDPVLESNQSIKYGQVTKINGNELTVAWATQVSSSDMSGMKGGKSQNQTFDPNATGNANATDNASATENGKASDNGNASGANGPGGSGPGGNAPGGDGTGDNGTGDNGPGGNGPGGNAPGGEMPSGGMDQAAPNNNGGNANSSSSGSSNKSSSNKGNTDKSSSKQKNRTMYQLTGEEDTIMIPVGTKVITSLGATTTFSRIAANDTLKLLMQTDDNGNQVVVGVWIVA